MPRIVYVFFVKRRGVLLVIVIVDQGSRWVKEVFKPLVAPGLRGG